MRRMSVATLLALAFSIFFATAIRAEEDVTITRLVLRDRVIVITSAPQGLLYSVSTPDGAVLDANLSEAQLAAKYPDVYESVRPAVASDEAPENGIWAGM